MATEQECLVSKISLLAILPVIKVILEEDLKTAKKFASVRATVQFVAKDPSGPVGAHLIFDKGNFEVAQGIADKPEITFGFSSVAKMNAMLGGKPVLPHIKGLFRIGLLINVFGVLLDLKKFLLPDNTPKNAVEARIKVKMNLYMISTALSVLNKSGDAEMVKWTSKQPERIYQFSVEPEGIACYLRVKAGKTKAGRGYYTQRKPFVHFDLKGVDGALPIITNQVAFVEGLAKGYVQVHGSPEYATQFNNFMARIADMVMG
ncbi:MAG: hypothetical protein QNJ97_11870 [Myxococcota bacterium]|nr:hypothetical protein [Myxococcota bacterium]